MSKTFGDVPKESEVISGGGLVGVDNFSNPTQTVLYPYSALESLAVRAENAESSASTSATSAATSATNAATSASSASASSASAGSSAATATTQAGIATTQAGAAATAALTAAAAGKLYASITAANSDSGLAIGTSFTAPLADGSLQAYQKTSSSGSSATAIGDPFIGSTVLSQVVSNYGTSELPLGRNMWDPDRAQDGYAVRATDGAVVAVTGYSTSQLIKVNPGGTFIANRALFGNGSVYGIAFYKAAGGFTSGITAGAAANTAVSVPADAAWVRFTVTTANKVGLMVVHGSTAPTDYRLHRFVDQYTERGDWHTQLAEKLRGKPNLFDPGAITAGAVVSSTSGATSANASFFTTDYIPVVPGTVVFTQTSTAGGGNGIAFYDMSKTFITGAGIAGPVVAGTQYTVPAGAAYMRTCFQNVSTNNAPLYQLQVFQATSAPSGYSEYGYTDPASASRLAQAIALAYEDSSLNLFDRSRLTNSAAALLASGAVSTNVAYANYSITDYMAVRPGSTVVCNKTLNNGAQLGFVWYDRSKQYLGATTGNITAGTTVTVPDAAFFFRTSILTNYSVAWPLVEFYNAAALPTTPGFGTGDLRLMGRRWAGLGLICHGDSNMQSTNGQQQWARGIAYLTKMNLLANYGVSGSKAKDALTGRVASDYDNATLVFLGHGGTNDYNGAGSTGGTPLGAITDSPSVAGGSSFYANLRYNIETLLTWNPSLRLAMITAWRRGNDTTANSLGLTLKDYRDAVLAVAQFYSIPCLDMYGEGLLNSLNFATWMQQADGLNLHPTDAYFQQLGAPKTARFLERI